MKKLNIISEIKSLAMENGGIPLGKQEFYNKTGIKESDWCGKYWTKWSDALIEAGFEPNLMQGPVAADVLIKTLVSITVELGKFPTKAELKMWITNNPEAPSHNVYDRLGNRAMQADIVADNLRKTGMDQLADKISNGVAPSGKKVEGFPAGKLIAGSVYLFKSGNKYKIGKTNSLGRRQRELKTLTPDPIFLIHEIKTDDINGIESYWHRRFEGKRCNGEWFLLDNFDLKSFKIRKFM